MNIQQPHRSFPVGLAAALLMVSTSAFAHHEAIFGPQSASVLSPQTYVTGQVFTRRTGPSTDRTTETTTVISGGISPGDGRLAFSLVVPFSFVTSTGVNGVRRGPEDAIIGARYRVDLPNLRTALSARESTFSALAALSFRRARWITTSWKGPRG